MENNTMKNFKTTWGALVLAATLALCLMTVPYAITENSVGDKKGTSESLYIGLNELNGDFGIAEAAKKGKIKGEILSVDMKTTNYIPFI
tara:strand:+ start:812 stop:1078 length:267 start_codon:yes stop_codon:yes gene_type:complete